MYVLEQQKISLLPWPAQLPDESVRTSFGIGCIGGLRMQINTPGQ